MTKVRQEIVALRAERNNALIALANSEALILEGGDFGLQKIKRLEAKVKALEVELSALSAAGESRKGLDQAE